MKANRSGPQHLDGADLLADDERTLVEPLQDDNERLARRSSATGAVPITPMHGHRKSLSVHAPPQLQTVFDPLGAVPSAYETTPSTQHRRRPSGAMSVNTMPLSPHPEDLPTATPLSPVGERKVSRDDGFE